MLLVAWQIEENTQKNDFKNFFISRLLLERTNYITKILAKKYRKTLILTKITELFSQKTFVGDLANFGSNSQYSNRIPEA